MQTNLLNPSPRDEPGRRPANMAPTKASPRPEMGLANHHFPRSRHP
ncbi:hypothetical protein OKW50_007958 [Paraburkholderia youngii]